MNLEHDSELSASVPPFDRTTPAERELLEELRRFRPHRGRDRGSVAVGCGGGPRLRPRH